MLKHKFELRSQFRQQIQELPYRFGYAGLGATVYYRSYSRKLHDGIREHWPDTVLRVAEGTLSARKTHMLKNHLHWDDARHQGYVEEMFTAMHQMHWLPPGRGLWSMGTGHVDKAGGMALNNCAFIDTSKKPEEAPVEMSPLVFAVGWTMEALMRGSGVGFNCTFDQNLVSPGEGKETYVIPDSREGWVKSVQRLLESFVEGKPEVEFDYSQIRLKGAPVKGFGGTASGPAPLMKVHRRIRAFCTTRLHVQQGIPAYLAVGSMVMELKTDYFDNDAFMTDERFEQLRTTIGNMTEKTYGTTRLVVDIFNAVGSCVVAGGIRRSAQIALSSPSDLEFLDLKNDAINPERGPIKWMSNNTVQLTETQQFTEALPGIVERVRVNGEPGIFNMINVREYGRVGKVHHLGEDWTREFELDQATGSNPCITGDSMIHTSNGLIPVKNLVGIPFMAVVDGEECPSTAQGFWSNGIQSIFKLQLNNGSTIKATAKHQFLTPTGWKQVQHMEIGVELKTASGDFSRIETISPFGQAEVFDCSIPGKNCYLANDIISHNCGEICLESCELCNLAEVFPDRCRDSQGNFSEDLFLKAVEYATTYASTVSLIPTHSPETNAIIARNRRIGISISGVVPMLAEIGEIELVRLLRKGYKLVRDVNRRLAREAGVVESIRVTTVKPSGSLSQLVGVTSGIHPATENRYVIRRVRESESSALAQYLMQLGVPHVRDEDSDDTIIFEFPVDQGPGPSAKDMSVSDQLTLARIFQRNWSDNSVSISVYFDPKTEGSRLGALLASYLPDLKSVSLFPRWVQDQELELDCGAVLKVPADAVQKMMEGLKGLISEAKLEAFKNSASLPYKNPPYEAITKERYQQLGTEFPEIDWKHFAGGDAEMPKGCDGDRCEL